LTEIGNDLIYLMYSYIGNLL